MNKDNPQSTLEEISQIIAMILADETLTVGDKLAQQAFKDRDIQLTKPPGALGRLEEIAEWVCLWSGKHLPQINHPRIAVFAGNHGVADQGVSAFPQAVTAQMVQNFANGGAAINQICQIADADLRIYELGLDYPTADFSQAPAMSDQDCARAISYGMMAVEEGIDLIALGEMGIANSCSAAAMAYALFGGEASDWTGSGTGVSGDALTHKTQIVDQAVSKHKDNMTNPLEVLRHLGGYELAAIVGSIIAARIGKVPVLLDGYACSVAASILFAIDPRLIDHCLVAHCSQEQAHDLLCQKINQEPLLNFSMRLGEASGASLAIPLVKAAVLCHSGMATFEGAAVSNKD